MVTGRGQAAGGLDSHAALDNLVRGGFMKNALFVIGGIVIVLGVAAVLLGLGVIPGHPGHRRWLVIGGGLAVVGIILEFIGGRLKSR